MNTHQKHARSVAVFESFPSQQASSESHAANTAGSGACHSDIYKQARQLKNAFPSGDNLVLAAEYPGMPSSASLARSIIILHCFSTFVAIIILVLSVRDCGILSLCLNPFFAILTIGYHVTMLLLAYKRPEDAPILPVGYTVVPYLLSASWLGAYIAMAVVLSSRKKEVPLFDLRIAIPQAMRITQKIQTMLDPLECIVMGDIAIKSTIQRRQECKSSKEADLT